jgi:transposase
MMPTASSTALKCAPSKLSSRQNQPARSNELYAERNLVERFNTLKHYRCIATRYHKTARNFLVGLQLGCGLARLK